MGINGLSTLITKHSANARTTTDWDRFNGKSVAFDMSCIMYKFKCAAGNDWKNTFVKFMRSVIGCGVIPVFVFDGPPPEEKLITLAKRMEKKTSNVDKKEELVAAYNKYNSTQVIDKILIPYFSDEIYFDNDMYKKKIASYTSASVAITEEDVEQILVYAKKVKIRSYISPTEAETLCCYLVNSGFVDIVASSDSDVLAYGVDEYIDLSKSNVNTVIVINADCVVEGLDIERESLTDLCIMLGTDYNDNIPKCGPVNSLKLIRQYKDIDLIKKSGKDVKILNHERVREIFSTDFDIEFKKLRKINTQLVQDSYSYSRLIKCE